MRRIVLATAISMGIGLQAAAAASISKTYAYFSITGQTAEQLEKSLERRGPRVNGSKAGHPGATELSFAGSVKYREDGGRCRIGSVSYGIKAKVMLPKLGTRIRGNPDLALYWSTLTRDIKRHEESHVLIAKSYAREVEDTVKALRPMVNCKLLEKKVNATVDRVLAEHDAAQARFDRIEASSFERRMLRLLEYRRSREKDG